MLGALMGLAAAAPMVSADAFIGSWICARPATGVEFTWEVRKDTLKGRWLVGRAKLNDEPVAMDVWRYSEDGTPDVRRQFSYANAMIEMRPTLIEGAKMELEGVYDPDGEAISMQESVEFISENEFEAQWRYWDEEAEKWQIDSDEVCRK